MSGSPDLGPDTCDVSRSSPSTKLLFLSCSTAFRTEHDTGQFELREWLVMLSVGVAIIVRHGSSRLGCGEARKRRRSLIS